MRQDQIDQLLLAPAFEVAEASRYLLVPRTTLYQWFRGAPGHEPLLDLADDRHLSFVGLLEAHIVSSMRKAPYKLPLQRIRKGIDYLRQTTGETHPLIGREFKASRLDLFIEHGLEADKALVNISRHGQTGIRDVLVTYLNRVEYNDPRFPDFFPFTQTHVEDDPKIIRMNPKIGFGRPVIGRTGIRTYAVAERFKAGESISSLAEDFERAVIEIEAAIRSELDLPAVA